LNHPEAEIREIVNRETRHEDSDVNVRALLWAVVIFIVFAIVTHLVLYLQFHAYAKHFRKDDSQPLTMMQRPSDASVLRRRASSRSRTKCTTATSRRPTRTRP